MNSFDGIGTPPKPPTCQWQFDDDNVQSKSDSTFSDKPQGTFLYMSLACVKCPGEGRIS